MLRERRERWTSPSQQPVGHPVPTETQRRQRRSPSGERGADGACSWAVVEGTRAKVWDCRRIAAVAKRTDKKDFKED